MTVSPDDIQAIVTALKQFSDDEADMRDLANTFFATADDIVKTLATSCSSSDGQAWVDAAHKLKGSSGMLKAKKLWDLADRAEAMRGATEEEKTRMAQSIREAVDEIRLALRHGINC